MISNPMPTDCTAQHINLLIAGCALGYLGLIVESNQLWSEPMAAEPAHSFRQRDKERDKERESA
jgi:hypothetical protein